MPGLLSRMFRRRAAGELKTNKSSVGHLNGSSSLTTPLPVIDVWEKTSLRREDVVELLKCICDELKLRGLDTPLFLLPFRPSSDLTSTKTFVKRYFEGGRPQLRGKELVQELRLTDVLVLAGVLRWVWTRLDGGIVGWESYELFAKAEQDCNYSRDAFNLLIPLSVESELHTAIILDFFAFLASVAAHAKLNGFSGQKLARMVGWYCFDIKSSPNGFIDGYSNWEKAANATEHLFLAYLRSIAPAPGQVSSALPLSLSTLLAQTKYPPTTAVGVTSLLRITLLVRHISPTPFALLDRLARHSFVQTNPNERGDALEALIDSHSTYNDPTKALTTECLRVLKLISATNESDDITAALLRTPQSLEDKTWTRFADLGFDALEVPSDEEDDDDDMSRSDSPVPGAIPLGGGRRASRFLNARRPQTPSWGDFLVTGFSGPLGGGAGGFSLPPDKLLPPINATTLSGSSSRRSLHSRDGVYKSNLHELEKGEVKSVERSRVDDALWSVWMESLCGEEIEEKKAVFGRCVIVETNSRDSSRRWLVVEEIVKGAEIIEPLPQLKGGKKLSKKQRKAQDEEEKQRKRAQQRRSTSDLLTRHREEESTLVGRELRAQALAKQTATLRTIKEKEPTPARPQPRRNSTEGRPSVMLGVEVSRAMKWAEGYEKGGRTSDKSYTPIRDRTPEPKREIIVQKAMPPPPPPAPAPAPAPAPVLLPPVQPPKPAPVSTSSPTLRPQVQEPPRSTSPLPPRSASPLPPRSTSPLPPPRATSPLPPTSTKNRPVLLPQEPMSKSKSPPQTNRFMKFLGGKSKEEKEVKRASRTGAASPMPPPSPTPYSEPSHAPVQLHDKPMVEISEPVPAAPEKEWEETFDGTHRAQTPEATTIEPVKQPIVKQPIIKPPVVKQPIPPVVVEDYRPATPPTVPIVRSETPTRASDDEDYERWAQIRKNIGQRAMNRMVAPTHARTPSDEIGAVDVPRTRQRTTTGGSKSGEGEDEESVDARVARIRERVKQLTAGMNDD